MLTLQLCVVAINVLIIMLELLAMRILGMVRSTLRWIVLVLPSRWGEARRRLAAAAALRAARTFEEWQNSAAELDALDGAANWRAQEESDLYDFRLVKETTKRLRRGRRTSDTQSLMFVLSSVMDRHFAGIDSPPLYSRARTGTKLLIEDFILEVQRSLAVIASSSSLTRSEKIAFFESCRASLGRTVLAMSGGGALALAHAGVVRTLIRRGLLPRVVSGTSGGSIVAGLMAICTDEVRERQTI